MKPGSSSHKKRSRHDKLRTAYLHAGHHDAKNSIKTSSAAGKADSLPCIVALVRSSSGMLCSSCLSAALLAGSASSRIRHKAVICFIISRLYDETVHVQLMLAPPDIFEQA